VVLDAAGDTVRALEGPAQGGLHTAVWDLRHDPPYTPETEQGGGGGFFGTPRGPTVLPGRYTVRLETAGLVMEEAVDVRLDSRVEVPARTLAVRQQVLMDAHALGGPVYRAQQAARRLGEQLDEVRDLLGEHEDASDALRAQADSLRERVRETARELGSVNQAARLGNAVEGSFQAPTADQRWQLDEAWADLPPLIGRLNALVSTDVPALYGELNRLGIRPDPGEPLELPRRPPGG
jgi:hypothetical protein